VEIGLKLKVFDVFLGLGHSSVDLLHVSSGRLVEEVLIILTAVAHHINQQVVI
jgi:hypothetical protein